MKRLILFFTLILSLISLEATAHGLRMTTAEIALRRNNHLTITIRTSLNDLFQQMDWAGKPVSLLHLAAADKQVFGKFRSAIIKLLQPIPVQAGKYPLKNRRLRLPALADLQALVRAEVAEQALQQSSKHNSANHTHTGDDRKHYLRAELSGFINSDNNPAQQSALQVVFPRALGKILVTYSKPQTQTISPGKDSSYYRQAI
ncbi:hypothetical protein [Oceanospirillum beijerinckii]|uniref:hypothetical protein n=1 Tax=Oceanospirillum beijerinckii TaxID=64976 RepID=UPI0003FEA708|nr:hypothetical protein [Oceanospirillum beijerinckii]